MNKVLLELLKLIDMKDIQTLMNISPVINNQILTSTEYSSMVERYDLIEKNPERINLQNRLEVKYNSQKFILENIISGAWDLDNLLFEMCYSKDLDLVFFEYIMTKIGSDNVKYNTRIHLISFLFYSKDFDEDTKNIYKSYIPIVYYKFLNSIGTDKSFKYLDKIYNDKMIHSSSHMYYFVRDFVDLLEEDNLINSDTQRYLDHPLFSDQSWIYTYLYYKIDDLNQYIFLQEDFGTEIIYGNLLKIISVGNENVYDMINLYEEYFTTISNVYTIHLFLQVLFKTQDKRLLNNKIIKEYIIRKSLSTEIFNTGYYFVNVPNINTLRYMAEGHNNSEDSDSPLTQYKNDDKMTYYSFMAMNEYLVNY